MFMRILRPIAVIALAIATLAIACGDDDAPIDDWPFAEDAELVACSPVYGSPGDLWGYPAVSTKDGCDALDNLRAERDQMAETVEWQAGHIQWQVDELAVCWRDLDYWTTSCAKAKKDFENGLYFKSGRTQDVNFMRRECGDEEAARHFEATLLEDAETSRHWSQRPE